MDYSPRVPNQEVSTVFSNFKFFYMKLKPEQNNLFWMMDFVQNNTR